MATRRKNTKPRKFSANTIDDQTFDAEILAWARRAATFELLKYLFPRDRKLREDMFKTLEPLDGHRR